MGSNIELQKH